MTKGVVSLVSQLFSSSTQKGGRTLRGQVSRLGAIFQTTAVETIYGLLFAGLLIASLPSIEAQSSGNSYTLQAGDEITEIKIVG